MPLLFDYRCDTCGKWTNNQDMESFICGCSGTFRLVNGTHVPTTTFEPHFCPTLKQEVTSWADQEKKARAFRSPDHPEGFTLLQENKKYMNHLKKIVKNKEDVRAEQYAKDGIKYPKGKQVYFKEDEGRFVNKFSKEPIDSRRYSIPSKPLRVTDKLKTVVLVLGFLLVASTGFCKIPGVPYVTLDVKGKSYEVPIHEPEFTKEDAKLIMETLNGNRTARKVVLADEKEKFVFIGDGTKIRWLHITANDEWVTEL